MSQSRVGNRAEPHFATPPVDPGFARPEPELRARRVEGPQSAPPGPIYVRAGEAPAVQDAIDKGKSRFGWAGEWARSAGKFGLGTAVLTAVVAAVGHLTGADVPSATAVLFNGALVAVAYKPLEWAGAKLCSLAGRAVSSARAKVDDFMKNRAEAQQRRAEASIRNRGAELDDDVGSAGADRLPPQDRAGAGAPLTKEEVIQAIQRLAAQDFATMNPGQPVPEITPDHARAINAAVSERVTAGDPEALAAVDYIRRSAQEARAARAGVPGGAPREAAPPDEAVASSQPAPARGPEVAPDPAEAAPAPRATRSRRPPRPRAERPPEPRPPVQGEGAGYRIVDDGAGSPPPGRPAARG